MKILFFSHFYHPHIGGVEKHIQLLSQELLKDGHEVTLITSKHKPNLKNYEIVDGIKVHRISLPKTKIIGLFTIWIKLFKFHKLFKNSDVVHVHDVFIWILPYRILHLNKPIFLTHHGWEGVYPIPLKNILMKKLSNAFSNGSIAVGDFIPKYYGIKPNFVIYGATEQRKKYAKVQKTILYLGRLDKDTGLEIFLESAKKLNDYKIEFCGDGELIDECKKFGKVHGFVTDPSKFLQRSQFCVISGYLSLLEAISYGCIPIAIYNNPLRRDYFKLSPFAKQVILAGDTNELLKKIAKESIEKVNIAEYSWKNLKKIYYKLWYNRTNSS